MANVGEPTYLTDLNSLLPTTVRKPADTGRTSTTSATADPDLSLTLEAGQNYVLLGMIAYTGDPAGDMKGNFSLPSGATLAATYRAQGSGASATAGSIVVDLQSGGTGTLFTFGCLSSSTALTGMFLGSVYGGSGGTFAFTWAQSSSNATATTLKAGSFLTLIKST